MKIERYRCERCHKIRGLHKDGACPDGKGSFTQREHPRGNPFASQSFTEGQVEALAAVVKKLLAGNADVSVITRREDFQVAAAKILRMKQRVDLMRNGKIPPRRRSASALAELQ